MRKLSLALAEAQYEVFLPVLQPRIYFAILIKWLQMGFEGLMSALMMVTQCETVLEMLAAVLLLLDRSVRTVQLRYQEKPRGRGSKLSGS